MNIGIIGTGNISSYLLEQANHNHVADGRITAVSGRNKEVDQPLNIQYNVGFYTDFQEFLKAPLILWWRLQKT